MYFSYYIAIVPISIIYHYLNREVLSKFAIERARFLAIVAFAYNFWLVRLGPKPHEMLGLNFFGTNRFLFFRNRNS
jgi:hypothetical protein